jgi:hypothetical protein
MGPPGPDRHRGHRCHGVLQSLRAQRADAGDRGVSGCIGRCGPCRVGRRRHGPLRPRPGQPAAARRVARRTGPDLLGRGGSGRSRAVRHGRAGGRRGPERPRDHGARLPLAERSFGHEVRPERGAAREGRGPRHEGRAVPSSWTRQRRSVLRSPRPPAHASVRHGVRRLGPHQRHVQRAGQRQPGRADARASPDDGGLLRSSADRGSPAPVRLLPRDGRGVRGGGDQCGAGR